MLKIFLGIKYLYFDFKKKDCIPKIYWDLITKCWDQQPENRPSFSEIVKELKNDKYAIVDKEFDIIYNNKKSLKLRANAKNS